MEAVTGGIGEYNGFKLQLPRGVDQDKFDLWIDNFTPEMMEVFAPDGLLNMTVEQGIDLLKRSRVRSINNNTYDIVFNQTGQEAIAKADGMPLVIQWSPEIDQLLAEKLRQNRGQTSQQRRLGGGGKQAQRANQELEE